jgi:pheromone receptor transcription factor
MQPRAAGMPPNQYAMTPDQQQALHYQAYLQQQQQQTSAYPMSGAPIPGRHPGHQ